MSDSSDFDGDMTKAKESLRRAKANAKRAKKDKCMTIKKALNLKKGESFCVWLRSF